jgi:hypothetical protein
MPPALKRPDKKKMTVSQGCQLEHFQTKNLNWGKFLRAWGMGNVGIFYAHLEYITAIWCTLW